MTLLLEQVGVDTTAPDGWTGTGAHTVTAWARGNHPAAGRIEQPVPDPPHAPRVEAHQVDRFRRRGHRGTGFGVDRMIWPWQDLVGRRR